MQSGAHGLHTKERDVESERVLASDQSYQYHNNRDDQEDMYESSDRIRRDDSQKPEDEEYDCDGYEHRSIFLDC